MLFRVKLVKQKGTNPIQVKVSHNVMRHDAQQL